MIEFELKDMTCGHCVGVVRQTVKTIDDDAQVDIDLATHKVRIDSDEDPQVFVTALTDAGYSPSA